MVKEGRLYLEGAKEGIASTPVADSNQTLCFRFLLDKEGTYRIREFAGLAGVTVRALHHYDRLGLLKPRRTQTGYRVYCTRDLETLEQIVALKFIGLALNEESMQLSGGPLFARP